MTATVKQVMERYVALAAELKRSHLDEEAQASLIAARTERRDLMNRSTAEHPQVVEVTARIRTLEEDRLPDLLKEIARELRREVESLERRTADSGTDLTEIPPRAIEEARLRRQVAMAERLYTDLRSRYETAALARAGTIPDVRILDEAYPPEVPTNEQRQRMALLAFLGFLGAGFAGALLLDRMGSRIRTPDEAASAGGFAVLGAVPHLRRTKGKKGNRNVNQVDEASRELRTNMEYDVLLMDRPPLAAGADLLVLSSLTGNLLLVIWSGSTDQALTPTKIEPLYRLPIRILGVVLNDLVPDRFSSYYQYYGSYLPDYVAGVEYENDGSRSGASKRIVGAGAPEE